MVKNGWAKAILAGAMIGNQIESALKYDSGKTLDAIYYILTALLFSVVLFMVFYFDDHQLK